MILEYNDWHLGYDQIVKDSRSSSGSGGACCSVWIFCNADVDSLAAARILTYIFRADNIPYQLRPCWSYSSLTKQLQSEGAEDIRALILLNLGASRNLTQLFQQEMLSTYTKVYVMDCRKPVHLSNVHAGHNIVVFWDETQRKEDIPSDGDNLSGNDSTTDEEEDSSSSSSDDGDNDDDSDEGEAEFEGDDEGKNITMGNTTTGDVGQAEDVAKEDTVENKEYDAGDEVDSDEDEDDDNKNNLETDSVNRIERVSIEESPRKRQKTSDNEDTDETEDESISPPPDGQHTQTPKSPQLPVLTPSQLHHQRRNRLRSYYSSGSFYGSPVAYVAYRLAAQKRWHDNGDLLWLACVGLSDAHIHSRIDMAGYAHLSTDLRTQCRRLFPNDIVDRVDKTIYAETLVGSNNNPNGERTQLTLSENGRILADTDYRFFLLRHQSLLNAMLHSNYVASRLQVWNNQGKQVLYEMLAKMGFPLEECQQPYAFMAPHLKRKLRDKISEYKGEFGLDKLEYTSFQRVTGYNSLLSASDVSYAIAALLESESADSFHTALEALNPKAISSNGGGSVLVNGGSLTSGIGSGITKAMQLQRKIVATAMSLVERKAIIRLRHFRYAFIACTSQEAKDSSFQTTVDNPEENSTSSKETTPGSEEYHIFSRPLALTRLAHWLMDMHRGNGKWTGSKNRPLVLCAENPITSTYLVVGYEFPDRQGLFLKNHFGQHFEMTCSSMQGSFRLDSFDSHVVEVDAKDVQRFLEQLHYLMDSV